MSRIKSNLPRTTESHEFTPHQDSGEVFTPVVRGLLSKYRSEITKCVKCGTCTTLCAVYKEDHLESLTPRGKISLLDAFLNGDLQLSKYLEESINKCAGCLKCQVNCPNGIQIDKIMIAAKAEIFDKRGIPFYKEIIFEKLLLEEKWFKIASLLNSAFGWIFFKNINSESQEFRFSKKSCRLMPVLNKEAFKKKYPAGLKTADPKFKIILYTGCLIDYFYPDIAEAFLSILSKNKIEVIIPSEQVCCGAPLLSLGDFEKAKALAKKNLDVFKEIKADFIVTLCATCLDTFKNRYDWILDQESYEKYDFLKEKFVDASVFLLSFLKQENFSKESPFLKVAYHDPCHLNFALGIYAEPRELIKMVKNVELVKLGSEGLCCGFGGNFNLDYYDLSKKINNHIVDAVRESATDLVLTNCPACKLQIKDGLNRIDSSVKVKHLVEFLKERL